MATYSRREVTTTRVEYFVSSPSNWAEVRKMMTSASNDLGEERARWDDAVWVEARDDEIVVWFEKSKETT